MNRDLVLAMLAFVLLGVGPWIAGWLQPSRPASEGAGESGRELERRYWRRLWTPALLPGIAVAILFGWRLQEPPVTDEPLTPSVVLFAIPAGLFWLRCLWRAFLASRRPIMPPPIATMGLLRPSVVVSAPLHSILDPEAMNAALSHERAHVRHFDPLRIWGAQIITDLQWPCPFAKRRFEAWLSALEIARDEEARLDGAHGEDIAAAVVAVARMNVASARAQALLTGGEASLASRVRRLLVPLPLGPARLALLAPLCVTIAITLGVLLGVTRGDSFVRALPFIAG